MSYATMSLFNYLSELIFVLSSAVGLTYTNDMISIVRVPFTYANNLACNVKGSRIGNTVVMFVL